jgi:hypothetical protein
VSFPSLPRSSRYALSSSRAARAQKGRPRNKQRRRAPRGPSVLHARARARDAARGLMTRIPVSVSLSL